MGKISGRCRFLGETFTPFTTIGSGPMLRGPDFTPLFRVLFSPSDANSSQKNIPKVERPQSLEASAHVFAPKNLLNRIWHFCRKKRVFRCPSCYKLSFWGACTLHFRLLSSSPTWINRIFEFKSFHPQKKKQVACSHERITPWVPPLTSCTSTKSAERSWSVKAFRRSKIQVEVKLRFTPFSRFGGWAPT